MSPTSQLDLPFDGIAVAAELTLGTTPWVLCSVRLPPTVGWWKCRNAQKPETSVCRRWWTGFAFSAPVYAYNDDDEVLDAKQAVSRVALSSIEWCGLPQPHPNRYPYRLWATGLITVGLE